MVRTGSQQFSAVSLFLYQLLLVRRLPCILNHSLFYFQFSTSPLVLLGYDSRLLGFRHSFFVCFLFLTIHLLLLGYNG